MADQKQEEARQEKKPVGRAKQGIEDKRASRREENPKEEPTAEGATEQTQQRVELQGGEKV